MSEPRYRWAGDSAVSVEYGNEISPEIAMRVRAMTRAVEAAGHEWFQEAVPSYRSVLVMYDPGLACPDEVVKALRDLDGLSAVQCAPPPRRLSLPVCYGEDLGPDLADVSTHTGLSEADVAAIHSSCDYLVYMIGFTIGFPYLGGMPSSIATPRLATPRTRVPAGSVGIAGDQTGVYPVDSPGGWRIIGRTPVRLAQPAADPPCLLQTGDFVRFTPVTRGEYEAICADVERGSYAPQFTEATCERGGAARDGGGS
ncbi:MAG: 5-oxoprolinase subunit PxpB [Clostridia bacterium]|nr:5-oxoprolinase subunit PxpB [Clostridia bacterium]